ncbi:hypothetical protein OIDMADRAFT_29714 [Oidiodendron maius Zn]|uniref:Mid2 domain-containing protein n=1 Tax=Oidiodendron maius (strain Zn) TaxID=913774 RepID=A0A0C3HEC5_OIDMZ|nr:hypothetical protein OIDMADRAFT_29714 [Oidiodendron maius Zn]
MPQQASTTLRTGVKYKINNRFSIVVEKTNCCRAPLTDLTCCSDQSAIFYLGGYENITTIGGAVGPGYQSTISPAPPSVAQSSNTASIDSQSTTDATSSSSAEKSSSSTATTTTPSSTTMTTTTAALSTATTMMSTVTTTTTSSTTSSTTTALPITEATSHSSSLAVGASAGIGVSVGLALILAAVGGYFFYKYSNRPRSAMLPDQVQMLPRGKYHKPELSAAIPEYAGHPYQQHSAEMDGNR